MFSPQAEADGPTPFFELALACRSRYADWVHSVREASGRAVDFRSTGVLNLALNEENVAELKARRDWQVRLGLHAEWIDGAEANRREPILVEDLPGALYLPEEAWVDSPALTRALAVAARNLGVRIEEQTPATSLVISGGRVTGVMAAGDRRFNAGRVVVASGAWASRLGGLPMPEDWIVPRRGQILAVRLPDPMEHILYTHGAYVVPRMDGDLLIGTTVEEAGYECVTTAGGLRSIVERVARFAPAIENAVMVRTMAGLRPESRDGLPLLGPLARLPGLVLAMGHYRNGILLAPLTGVLIAEAIVGDRVPDALTPFLPDRVPDVASGTARSHQVPC
jgi:glycine oxidase